MGLRYSGARRRSWPEGTIRRAIVADDDFIARDGLVEYRSQSRFNDLDVVVRQKTDGNFLADPIPHRFTALINTWPPKRLGQWRQPH